MGLQTSRRLATHPLSLQVWRARRGLCVLLAVRCCRVISCLLLVCLRIWCVAVVHGAVCPTRAASSTCRVRAQQRSEDAAHAAAKQTSPGAPCCAGRARVCVRNRSLFAGGASNTSAQTATCGCALLGRRTLVRSVTVPTHVRVAYLGGWLRREGGQFVQPAATQLDPRDDVDSAYNLY